MTALAPLFFLIFCISKADCQCPETGRAKLELCQTDREKMNTLCPNFYCGLGKSCNDETRKGELDYDPQEDCRAHKSDTTSGYCYLQDLVAGYKCHPITNGHVPSKYKNGECIHAAADSSGVCGEDSCPPGKFGSKTWATEPASVVWFPKECGICPDGSYSTSGSAHACQCPPQGTEAFAPDASKPHLKTKVRDCAKGTFNDRMYTNKPGNDITDWRPKGSVNGVAFEGTPCGACERCPLNSFSKGEASNVHCDCPSKGHRANANRTGMEQCPKGFYQDKIVQWARGVDCPTCKPCSEKEIGSFAGSPGQAECICPGAGYEANKLGTKAYPCQPGTFKNVTTCAFCEPCPEGSYQSTPGAHACAIPSAGHYALNGTFEQACIVGTYKPGKGPAIACQKCETGHYSPLEGQSACLPANVGHEPYSSSYQAIQLNLFDDQRPCEAGYHQDERGHTDSRDHICHPSNRASAHSSLHAITYMLIQCMFATLVHTCMHTYIHTHTHTYAYVIPPSLSPAKLQTVS